MAKLEFPDPLVTNPWQDPTSEKWFEHDGDGWKPMGKVDDVIVGANILINGDFRVNQRGITVWPENSWGYDKWYKLGIADNQIRQTIEEHNLVNGAVYTLSWEGGGTGEAVVSDSQDSGPSPLVTTPVFYGNIFARYDITVPLDATNIKLEIGSVPTPFQVTDYTSELVKCGNPPVFLLPTLNTGWVNLGLAGTTRFWKDYQGTVHLGGTLTRNSGTETVIFTLPVDYRPPAIVMGFMTSNGSFDPDGWHDIAVDPSGNVAVMNTYSNSVSLNGISFNIHE